MAPRKRFRPLELGSPTLSKRKVQKPLQEKATNLQGSPPVSKIGRDTRNKETSKTRKLGKADSKNIFNSKHVDLRLETPHQGLHFVNDSQKGSRAPDVRYLNNRPSHTLKDERQEIDPPFLDNSLKFEDIEQPPKSTSTPVFSQSSQNNVGIEPHMFPVPYYIAPSPMYNFNPYQNLTGNPVFLTPCYNPSLNYAAPFQQPELLYPNVNAYDSPLFNKVKLPHQTGNADREQNYEYLPIFPVSISNNGDFVGQEQPRVVPKPNKKRHSNSLDVDCSDYESSGQNATYHDSKSPLD
ncbi:spo13p [Saccharomyces arboricola H-6]|uniref:Spo13p n=1 Tax=Saccharomyces arboricola (strain H-6 / AS 2.3317 / CBS 10644) TaxID=1160507 RepID=J8LN21_SACAR|nr:spo13p [Saccharomyces arboricola H-6]